MFSTAEPVLEYERFLLGKEEVGSSGHSEICQEGRPPGNSVKVVRERKELHLVNTYYVSDSDTGRAGMWVVRKDTGSGI